MISLILTVATGMLPMADVTGSGMALSATPVLASGPATHLAAPSSKTIDILTTPSIITSNPPPLPPPQK